AIEGLQKALLRQNLKLAFYWDLDVSHPHFTAMQMLTLRGVLLRDEDRRIRPDEPLTRAEAAQLLYRAFDLWPSVSNAHFSDVPYQHPAFREIETLFDHGALVHFGIEPQWPKEGPYDAAQHAGFRQRNNLGELKPDLPVTADEFARLIDHLATGAGPLRERRATSAVPRSAAVDAIGGQLLTRACACEVLWRVIDSGQSRGI
ncbi:MAG TPA: S-layer homology domain-containing protein, partial [Candidatus Synoicihabitans sp.]|nr:S-layer homology domain-containing protein [Candidatus Synoicihabitans sp.]